MAGVVVYDPTLDKVKSAFSTRPLRILQLTDCHLPREPGERVQGLDTEGSFRAVLHQAFACDQPYDLVLLTGDLAEQPAAAVYTRLRAQLRRLSIPCICLPGNHDDPDDMRRFLLDESVTMANRHLVGNWQILCLDSTVKGQSGGLLDDHQLALVESAIAADPAGNLLIAVHHHPLPCGSPWMDRMMIRHPEPLRELLKAPGPGTRAVIFGHIHQAFDQTLDGVRFLGSPATSCQFEPLTAEFRRADLPPGYRWLELDPSGQIRSGVTYLGAGPPEVQP
jgi:Icc protein